jgi:hypothetical protein
MAGSAYSRSPKLVKGALVVFAADVPVPTSIVIFQLNPDQLVRRIDSSAKEASAPPKAGDAKGALGTPPAETFTLTVELSAIDGLEASAPLAMASGIHAQLAQLESLMYPSAAIELLNKGLALVGIATVKPATVPLVLLFWGPGRIVPVLVTSVGITEQQFDQLLNPIQAKVDLGLRVLTSDDLSKQNAVFRQLPLVRSVMRETLAATASVEGVAEVASSISF